MEPRRDWDALEERLEKLERVNRAWKKVGLAAGLGLFAMLTMGQAKKLRTLEADGLLIRDAKGTTRLRLGFTRDGTPCLWSFNAQGQTRLAVSELGLDLWDKRGKKVVAFGKSTSGSGALWINDAQGKLRAYFSDEGASFYDAKGFAAAQVGPGDKGGKLTLRATSGRVTATLDRGGLALRSKGRHAATLGPGGLALFNRSGHKVVAAGGERSGGGALLIKDRARTKRVALRSNGIYHYDAKGRAVVHASTVKGGGGGLWISEGKAQRLALVPSGLYHFDRAGKTVVQAGGGQLRLDHGQSKAGASLGKSGLEVRLPSGVSHVIVGGTAAGGGIWLRDKAGKARLIARAAPDGGRVTVQSADGKKGTTMREDRSYSFGGAPAGSK